MTLDASAYLRMAEGHLMTAEERLRAIPSHKRTSHHALSNILDAIGSIRSAVARLKLEKEEPCNTSQKS